MFEERCITHTHSRERDRKHMDVWKDECGVLTNLLVLDDGEQRLVVDYAVREVGLQVEGLADLLDGREVT